ncbi:MAG: DUF3999 family protein [Desulfamplus sp.]|nr:DUF3999 family protein [Desulfamplus sp.]
MTAIKAIFPDPVQKRKREWRELSNGSFSSNSRMEINFDAEGFFPIDAVQIKFPQTNSIIKAKILSASDISASDDSVSDISDANQFYSNQSDSNQSNSAGNKHLEDIKRKWNYRCEGVFYMLRVGGSGHAAGGSGQSDDSGQTDDSSGVQVGGSSQDDSSSQGGDSGKVGGSELVNGIFIFPVTSDRFWRIKVSQDGAGLDNAVYPPVLKVGFRPHEILFVARGNPPYTLAYGSVKKMQSNSKQGIPDTIFKAVNRDEIVDATYGAPTILGGDGALKKLPPPFPWKTWILWASLIGGVALIGFMVWSLARQMKIDS